MTRVTFLSPHADDIAWSIGALALAVAEHVPAADLVTVFSVSNYTPTIGSLELEAATAVRAAEDQEFCRQVGLTYRCLGLAEGLVRGYPDLESLFQWWDGRDDATFPEVLDKVRNAVPDELGRFVFTPIGLGRHIEHLICQGVATTIFTDAHLLFYEDLPYASTMALPAIEEKIQERLGKGLRPLVVGIPALERKEALVRIYTSQLVEIAWQRIRQHALRIGGAERVWGTPRAIGALGDLLHPLDAAGSSEGDTPV